MCPGSHPQCIGARSHGEAVGGPTDTLNHRAQFATTRKYATALFLTWQRSTFRPTEHDSPAQDRWDRASLVTTRVRFWFGSTSRVHTLPHIADGMHVGKIDIDVGNCDQGIVFGDASGEAEIAMPLTHSIATRLGKTLTDARKNSDMWRLWPESETRITIEYVLIERTGPSNPETSALLSFSRRTVEDGLEPDVAEYSGPAATASSMEDTDKLIVEKKIRENLEERTQGRSDSFIVAEATTHLHLERRQILPSSVWSRQNF